ncbi:TonB-dependent receptor [Novosphingobium resinovorum]|nr:TonB-dependent receptor [Novosphingobium resinovorum]
MLAVSASYATVASAQDEAADGGTISNEIVVTAQRKPELLSKAALSISAVTGNDLKSAGVVDALSLTTAVPTVKIDQANGLQITIRGVSSADGTEKGDPSAAFMLNGVYLARQQSLSGAFFDLDRIEVLRGPQGTLYGRNATAGVVNVLTKRPTDRFEAAVTGEFSNFDTQRIDGMINLPVTENFALRAAGAYNKHDSYLISGNGSDQRLGQDQDEYAGRLSADLKFGSENQGNLFVVGDYAHQGGVGPQAVSIGNFYSDFTTVDPVYLSPSQSEARTVTYPVASTPYQNNKIYGISGELTWDFGPVNLTYLGSYRVFDRDTLGTYVNANTSRFADVYTTGKTKSNSQELRMATSGDGPLEAVVGLYYFRERSTNVNTILHDYAGFALYGFLQSPVIGESKAVFGQATYHLTDTLRVTGGIRYSKDEKSRTGLTIYNRTSSIFDPATYTVSAVNNAKRSFSKVTWKAGAEYDVSQDVLFYANAATGYKAGGFNDGCTAGSPGCTSPISDDQLFYNPEELTAYEAGLKGKFLDNAVTLSIAGFYYNYTNMQLSSPGTLGQTTLNAGKARIKGVETSATITPSSRDRFDVSFNYLDAYYTDYSPTSTLDFAGRSLDNAPEWVVTAGYTHTFPLGNGGNIEAHADTRLSDSYLLTNFANGTQFRNPSNTKTNLTLTYNAPEQRWFLQGFLKNAENAINFAGYGLGRVYVSEPRLYGIRAGVRF